MKKTSLTSGAVLGAALTLFAIGCSQASAPGGRVFFVSPKRRRHDQAAVDDRVRQLGVTVAAVPPGELTAGAGPGQHDSLSPGDRRRLPAGWNRYPEASPWVHFGDGKNVIEMQLPPGQHKLAVQAGDDMHRTIAGLCEVITVTVAE
jgi:hypothetical protein